MQFPSPSPSLPLPSIPSSAASKLPGESRLLIARVVADDQRRELKRIQCPDALLDEPMVASTISAHSASFPPTSHTPSTLINDSSKTATPTRKKRKCISQALSSPQPSLKVARTASPPPQRESAGAGVFSHHLVGPKHSSRRSVVAVPGTSQPDAFKFDDHVIKVPIIKRQK